MFCHYERVESLGLGGNMRFLKSWVLVGEWVTIGVNDSCEVNYSNGGCKNGEK